MWRCSLIFFSPLLHEITTEGSINTKNSSSMGKTRRRIIVSVASIMGVILLVLSVMFYVLKKKKAGQGILKPGSIVWMIIDPIHVFSFLYVNFLYKDGFDMLAIYNFFKLIFWSPVSLCRSNGTKFRRKPQQWRGEEGSRVAIFWLVYNIERYW